jgi:arsenate reductase (thioredoxin)
MSSHSPGRPTVLFVCVHNAGRSQMAAGYLAHLGGERVIVLSAGSQPAHQVNPVAVAAMAEDGIDIATKRPKLLTTDVVQGSDVVITMGCGDACPVYPGKKYEDWYSMTRPGEALPRFARSATRSRPASRACWVSCSPEIAKPLLSPH